MIFNRNKEVKVACTKTNDAVVLAYPDSTPFEIPVFFRDKSGKIRNNGHKIRVNRSGTIQMVKDLAG